MSQFKLPGYLLYTQRNEVNNTDNVGISESKMTDFTCICNAPDVLINILNKHLHKRKLCSINLWWWRNTDCLQKHPFPFIYIISQSLSGLISVNRNILALFFCQIVCLKLVKIKEFS